MSTKRERKLIYNTHKWRLLREKILSKHDGLCANCKRRGYTNEGNIIHHIKPWKDGKTQKEKWFLCWDENNLEPVCSSCHKALHFEMIDINNESNEILKLGYQLLGFNKNEFVE